MKNNLLTILFILCSSFPLLAQDNATSQPANASDIIFTLEGDEIPAIILLVNESEVQYRKASNPDGPVYSMKNANIFMIKYRNGEKDVFKKKAETKAENTGDAGEPVFVEVKVAEDNQELIAKYNKYYQITEEAIKAGEKNNGKPAKYHDTIFGIGRSSVLSNQDFLISVRVPEGYLETYYIYLYNKTDKIIYVDLAKSFLNNKSMFKGDVTLSTNGQISGVGVNIVGVNVGGGASSSTTTMKQQQRILAFPPHEEAVLFELNMLFSGLKAEDLESDKLVNYTEETGRLFRKFFFTYSLSPSFQTYSQFPLVFFVKQTWGIRRIFNPWVDKDEYFLVGL